MTLLGGGRPWPGLASLLLILSMALFVASISSSNWIENQFPGTQFYEGPFETCARDYSKGIRECHRVDNSCVTSFSDPIGDVVTGANCHMVRATRAFMILGLIWAALSFLFSWLAWHAVTDDIMYRIPAVLTSLASFICGLIGWAVYIGMVQKYYPSGWNYGWGSGLAIGAWLAPFAATLANLMPSPARDLKTGEIIARDTVRGRRGSWADVFTRDYWFKGADWGGHDYGERSRGVGYERGPAGAHEERRGYERGAPPGVGYRESGDTTTGPHYRHDTGRPFEHGRFAESGQGLFPSERDRELAREREWRESRQTGTAPPTMTSGAYQTEPLREQQYVTSSQPTSRETSTATEHTTTHAV